MTEPLSLTKFLTLWLPVLGLAIAVPDPATPLGSRFLIDIFGLSVPVVTCTLGALGIAVARPFAMRAEADLGWPLRALVTLILLVVVQLWIVESRPGWLFAFVVAIGLGFSGFSLIEAFGENVRDFIRRVFEGAAGTIGKGPEDR